MTSLKEAVASGPDQAWSYVLTRLSEHTRLGSARDAIQSELTELICKHYWWLAGKFFILEGDLGWGPGHRDDHDGDGYPPPVADAFFRLKNFIQDLALLPPTEAVQSLARQDGEVPVASIESRLFRKVFGMDRELPQLVEFLYSRIVAIRSVYEIGAARCYKRFAKENPIQALAGMTLILVRRLNHSDVEAESAILRRNLRVGQPMVIGCKHEPLLVATTC